MKKNLGHLRVIDVNFNRCKEGLRVVEDICRFILKDDSLRKKTRLIRHGLDKVRKLKLTITLNERNAKGDLGKKVDHLEMRRITYLDILFINLQRAKESLRVLEEFSKIDNKKQTPIFKRLRYRAYNLEKEVMLKTGRGRPRPYKK